MEDYYGSDYASPSRQEIDMNPQAEQPAPTMQSVPAPYSEQHPQMQQMHHWQHPHHWRHPAGGWTWGEVIKRIFKYIFMGLAVAFAAYLIFRDRHYTGRELLMIGAIAAVVFAVLDIFAPAVSLGAKVGTGFGLGYGLIMPPIIP
jgi:hypothetical protein